MFYVFYIFIVANYSELVLLLHALAIGDGYWGNMHVSSYNWPVLLITFTLFILGTIVSNRLLKRKRLAFWIVCAIFTCISLSIVYYAGSSVYILLTTQDRSSQPVGLSSHLAHYVYLFIYFITLCVVLPLLVSLIRNKRLFLNNA